MADIDSLVVVTGGTSGLGLQLAEQLVHTGEVEVILTGRSAATTDTIARRIGARGLPLDLGSLAAVHAFAAQVADLTGGRPLRGLVANAGIQLSRPSVTVDGFETTFGVNHIGHVALIEDLLRLTGPPRRLILVASGTHDPALHTGMPDPLEQATADELAHPAPPDAGEPAGLDGRRRYASAKLANVRTAFELARRLAGTTQVYAFDPGLMPGTGLIRDRGAVQRAVWATLARGLVILPGVQTPTQAARQLTHLVLDSDVPPTGTYLTQATPGRASGAARDLTAQRTLYDDTLTLIAAARPA